ncbi:MAG: hypothetical protein EZS28_040960, partial [Streblomastix strix]
MISHGNLIYDEKTITEVLYYLSEHELDKSVKYLFTAGRLIRGVAVRVVTIEEPHTVQPVGLIGEVWIQGPTVAQGYWGRE